MRRRLSSPWVPGSIAAGAALPLLAWWARGEVPDLQWRNLITLIVGILVALLLIVWVLAFSGLPLRVRLGILAVPLLLAAVFRIEGVSGDLVPIVRLRGAGPAIRSESTPPALDRARDFPRFFGPEGDGVVPGVELDPDWTARPPRLAWRRAVGEGWSGFSVAGRRALTQEQDGLNEVVAAYDLADGRPLWRHAYPARYDTKVGGPGPRGTPTVHDGRVYAFGATGVLSCLELATGRALWSADTLKDSGAAVPDWGAAGSPWIEGDRVIVQPGAGLAAYDRKSGARAWLAPAEPNGYASPVVRELGGRRQVIAIHGRSATGHDPRTGEKLWSRGWRGANPKVAQPVLPGDDRVIIAAGYGIGAESFRVNGGAVEELWASPRLKAKFSNSVLKDGHLFGFDDGRLVCIRAADGERAWQGPRLGHGQLLLVGGLLLATLEAGEVLLADAAPAAFRERARLAVFDHKHWNSPALAGAFLLLRTDREAVCLELPLR